MNTIQRFAARRPIPFVIVATLMLASVLALGSCADGAPPTPTPTAVPTPTPAPTPTAAPTPTQAIADRLSAAERAEIFEAVWQTVHDNYFDPTFGGQDWQAIGDAYRQKLATVQDDRAFWVDVLNPMLFELGVSHVGALPPELSSQMDPMTFSAGTLGMDVRSLDGQVVITEVTEGFPAAQAGLKPGLVITALGGRTPEQIAAEALQPPPDNERNRRANLVQTLRTLLYGEPGDEIEIRYLDENGQTQDATLRYAERSASTCAQFDPNLPTACTEFAMRRLAGGVGYVRFSAFLPTALDDVLQAIEELHDAPALLIDLRGNPGGVFPVRKAIASQLVGERTLFMRYQLRDEMEEAYLDFVADPYPGLVVILVDELSASSSEEFAGSLKALGRATIVGSQTPGRCLVANLTQLPGGGVLSYPYGQSQTPDGRVLESNGVVPDVEVGLDRDLLLQGIDSQLEAAIEYVTSAAPAGRPESGSSHTITGVSVVDVEQGRILPDQTVVIEDGLIRAIGPQTELSAPTGAHLIDGRGLYLMPGLVDAHVHYFDPPVFGRVMIANGVLLVRDMGQPTDQVLKLRAALNQGEMLGPEMIATGAILDGDPPLIPAISLGLGTSEAARAAVRQQAEAGVDQIKVYSSLDKDVFLAILDEARQVGLKVVGHVPDSISLEDAAAAGMASSEHLFGFDKVIVKLLTGYVRQRYTGMGADTDYFQRLGEVDPEQLQGVYQRLRASGLTVCPTVIVFSVGTGYRAMMAENYQPSEYISPGILDLWRSQWASQDDLPGFIWQNWAQMVSELNRAGVPLMVGTDLLAPGIVPGFAVHQEMAIWQDVGILPADILRSATLAPAQFMGLGARLGTVAEGKAASLVLVTANPLDDVRNAQLIDSVFLRGEYYSRADLDRLLAEARELAKPQP